MKKLTAQHKRMLRDYHAGMTQVEIGEVHGVTPRWVNEIVNSDMGKKYLGNIEVDAERKWLDEFEEARALLAENLPENLVELQAMADNGELSKKERTGVLKYLVDRALQVGEAAGISRVPKLTMDMDKPEDKKADDDGKIVPLKKAAND